MTFTHHLLSRRMIVILIMIILSVSGGLWYVGGKILAKQEASETAENTAILAEYDRIQALVKQKQATGADFERFSIEDLGKSYTTGDLLIESKETQESIARYGREVRKALLPISIEKRNPVTLALEAYEDSDVTAIEELITISSNYQQTTSDLAKIKIPPSAVTAHLRLINNTREMSSLLGIMSEINIQPIKALEASTLLNQRLQGLFESLLFMNNYFADKKIIFTDEEQIPPPIFTD
jgi:hypothetical protein